MKKLLVMCALALGVMVCSPDQASAATTTKESCVVVQTSPGNYVNSCSDPSWENCSTFMCENYIGITVRSSADAFCQAGGDYTINDPAGEVLISGSSATYAFTCVEKPVKCTENCNGEPLGFGRVTPTAKPALPTLQLIIRGIKGLFRR